MAHARRIEVLDQEDAGLLHFGDEGSGVLAVLHGHRYGQDHFVEVAVQLLLASVQVQADGRVPFLAEDFRGLRRLERQVAQVDALQGELGLLLVGSAVGSLLGHFRAFPWVNS